MPPNKNSRTYRNRAADILIAQYNAGMALRAYGWDLIENHNGGKDDAEHTRTNVEGGAHITTRLNPEALAKYRQFEKDNAPPSLDELESMEWEDDPEMGERFTKSNPIMPTPFPDPMSLATHEDLVNFRFVYPQAERRPSPSPTPEPEPEPTPDDEGMSLPSGSKDSDSTKPSDGKKRPGPEPSTDSDSTEPSPERAQHGSQFDDKPPTKIRLIGAWKNGRKANDRLAQLPAPAPGYSSTPLPDQSKPKPPSWIIILKIPGHSSRASSSHDSHQENAFKPSASSDEGQDAEGKPAAGPGRPTRMSKDKAMSDITNQYEINPVTRRPISWKRTAWLGRDRHSTMNPMNQESSDNETTGKDSRTEQQRHEEEVSASSGLLGP
ncbi:hypothetical protein B0T22DRAFT_436554 [Podospora appendiculata]|uniref:Uncharacterized protein n=1 Tax=Podospora appendiculata TaxID=314037 RepID=A0AAE0XHJ3_9PEZI|nr:hypothetical protein B0T22DRAFT_436554 [Podospora appendiculata]